MQWVLATTGGWILGLVIGGEASIGALLGLAQWLVLRRYLLGMGWWVFATALGWIAGWGIVVSGAIVPAGTGLVTSVFTGAVFGLTMGIGQWILLRRRVNFAGMWLLLSVSGWSIGLAGFLGSILVGAVVGVVTGLALDWLLRYPLTAYNK